MGDMRKIQNNEMYSICLQYAVEPRLSMLAAHALTQGYPGEFTAMRAEFDALGGPADASVEQLAQKLRDEAGKQNARYDSGVSLTVAALELAAGFYRFRGEEAKARQIDAMSARMLPEGGSHTLRSFSAQGGHAERTAAQVSDDDALKAALAALPLPEDSNLYDHVVAEWIQAGRKLGEVERQRMDLPQDAAASLAQRRVQARNRWFALAAGLAGAVGLTRALTDADREFILRPIVQTAEKAAGRSGEPNPAADPTQPEPTTA